MTFAYEGSLFHLLHRASQVATGFFHEERQTIDVTPRQFVVLSAVAKYEGCSQTQLVEKTGIDKSTLAELAARLTQKGYIERRHTDHDARAYQLRLTADGKVILNMLSDLAQRTDDRISKAVFGGDRQELILSLQAIAALTSPADHQTVVPAANS
jgi:DNA-binding MarR family transcriptional regulator